MIFTFRGFRWMVDERGFLRFPTECRDVYRTSELRIVDSEAFALYGWIDLV